MSGNNSLYEYNVTMVKQLGENIVKIVYVNTCRVQGIEENKTHIPKGTVNKAKLSHNITRSKTKVKEMVLCNSWDYWCTFTISPKLYDRYNLKTYVKDFTEFLHTYNRRCSEEDKVRYLFIPEMHSDGAWHLHGFLKGIRPHDIYTNDNGYLSWKQYSKKFGFISMDSVKDKERCSSYILKYMTKDSSKNVTDLGAHMYYCSKGLNKPKIIFRGHAQLHAEWDYEHPDGYCKIKTLDCRNEDLEQYLEVLP